jgi:hypothetical protein
MVILNSIQLLYAIYGQTQRILNDMRGKPSKCNLKKILNCIGKNMPSKRTMISSEHKVLYKSKMVEAKYLTKVDGIYKVKYHGEILYNVLMETHEKMVTNNLIVETLHPENIVAELYRYYTNPTYEDQMNYIKIQENYLKNMLELKRRIQRK